MAKLELREGAGVFTPGDEQVGRVSGFVLDPATNAVTHIVVQKGWLLPEDKIIPFDMVTSATEDRVALNRNIENVDDFPAFEQTHYITPRDADGSLANTSPSEERRRAEIVREEASEGMSAALSYAPAYYWYPPQGYIGYRAGGLPPMETIRNIPEGTVPLKEGTDILSSDGEHVGDVERLLVEPDSNQVSHVLISQGVFFKDRKLIPMHWVTSVTEENVHLSVTSEFLKQLPSYEE
jgi:uncharacterized protein YrrD